jgi:hypothetical protein
MNGRWSSCGRVGGTGPAQLERTRLWLKIVQAGKHGFQLGGDLACTAAGHPYYVRSDVHCRLYNRFWNPVSGLGMLRLATTPEGHLQVVSGVGDRWAAKTFRPAYSTPAVQPARGPHTTPSTPFQMLEPFLTAHAVHLRGQPWEAPGKWYGTPGIGGEEGDFAPYDGSFFAPLYAEGEDPDGRPVTPSHPHFWRA